MNKAFYYAYARHILDSALQVKADDVLAINTEEKNMEFARILAEVMKERTDLGSYLMLVDGGKKGDTTELYSDYVMDQAPTVFIYLQSYKEYENVDELQNVDAPSLQRFRHLSSPLVLEKPNIIFATVPCPSDAWGRMLEEDGDISTAEDMISDLLGFQEEEVEAIHKDIREMTRYDNHNLNREKMFHCHVETYDGMTDIDFNFLPVSSFRSFEAETITRRSFIPSLIATCHARPVSKISANGHVNVTRPFMLFGRKINHLSLTFQDGKIVSYETDEESSKLLERFFSLDEDNLRLSELIISDEGSRASEIDYTAYPEWDRLRTTHITLGQAHSESIEYTDEDDAIREGAAMSLSYLSLPIGNDEMSITLSDQDGNECEIMEDGMIKEDY